MKTILTISVILIGSLLRAQSATSKNFIGMQFGGQAIVGYSYDRTLLQKKFFKLNAALGFVINEYADDTDPSDRPINGLNFGVIGLYDVEIQYLYLESGFYSSPYFYKSLTFVNYYGWFGLRINSKNNDGGFASIGWTPSFYFSKKPPEFYNNVQIGIKLGFNF